MVSRQEIGQRVLLRRRELELTQKALAARCGFPYQVICGLERGRQSIYAERLAALAQALHISADWLLGLGTDLPGHLVYDVMSPSGPSLSVSGRGQDGRGCEHLP